MLGCNGFCLGRIRMLHWLTLNKCKMQMQHAQQCAPVPAVMFWCAYRELLTRGSVSLVPGGIAEMFLWEQNREAIKVRMMVSSCCGRTHL